MAKILLDSEGGLFRKLREIGEQLSTLAASTGTAGAASKSANAGSATLLLISMTWANHDFLFVDDEQALDLLIQDLVEVRVKLRDQWRSGRAFPLVTKAECGCVCHHDAAFYGVSHSKPCCDRAGESGEGKAS